MVTVPAKYPVSTPDSIPTPATEGMLLVHVPPGVAQVKVSLDPIHKLGSPAIGAGAGFTVIGKVE